MTNRQKVISGLWLTIAHFLCFQWIIIKQINFSCPWFFAPLIPGLAIFGAAFILSWAVELAQMDIPHAFAFALLALVAVLPEYAVDIYFSWMAARNPHYAHFPVANMTGANRLLIGLGWGSIIIAYWIKSKKTKIELASFHSIEIKTLAIATIYSFIIPLKQNLSIVDAVVLVLIFTLYIAKAIRSRTIEPELGIITSLINSFSKPTRRIITIFLFLISAYTIFISAEPFSESLLATGRALGIEEFILVQWIAPLASEAPEFIVAITFAMRNLPGQSFSTVVSAKINQWTLLVGMIPIIYTISGKSLHPLQLDSRQIEELILTSAQSLFAVSILSNFKFSIKDGILLIVLFSTQLVLLSPAIRYGYSAVYLILTVALFIFSAEHRNGLIKLFLKSKD